MAHLFGFQPRKLNGHPKPLGRVASATDEHILSHPLRLAGSPLTVEKTLALPYWHWTHDQGSEGACVGHGSAMERAIREKVEGNRVRFDPWWLWDEAKIVDEWPDTNPGDDNGTSVNAAYFIIRSMGMVKEPFAARAPRVANPVPDLRWSITENQWATSVDEMRACIARGQPVTIGVNWYSNFDRPVLVNRDYFIGRGDLGRIRGGHCVCIYGASDKRQAFKVKNSWGNAYPLVWLPYLTMERLLREDGEATVVTDND